MGRAPDLKSGVGSKAFQGCSLALRQYHLTFHNISFSENLHFRSITYYIKHTIN